jgi:UDP-GlcNAc:undecaprenyl-phosphate GlcNAc-1-phosphate transferase
VLSPGQKFFGQALSVLCYIKAGFYMKGLFFSNAWNIGISAFWFMLLINAFNLVDVMDGLATTLACAIVCSYIVAAVFLGQYELVLLLAAFAGSLLGFFVFNRPPARVYLGDAGSLFLGGFLASIPFALSWSEYNIAGYLVPLIICAIPLLECGTLILVRSYKHIPFYLGSPDHFSIFLQAKGWHKNTILVYSFVLSLFCGALACGLFLNILTVIDVFSIGILSLFFWFLLLL